MSSAATRSGRGANIAPKTLMTRSNAASGKPSCSASPSRNSAVTPACCARSRACSIRFGAISTPITAAPARAAGIAVLPVPQATSSRRVPGMRLSRATNSSSAASAYRAMTPKSPAIQVSRIFAFKATMSGAVVPMGEIIRLQSNHRPPIPECHAVCHETFMVVVNPILIASAV